MVAKCLASLQGSGAASAASLLRQRCKVMGDIPFFIYFLVLLGALVIQTPVISGPWFFLLRAFFPNSKFFHAVGHVPHLFVRFSPNHADWSDWTHIYPRELRRLQHLIHNPQTNLALTQQNLVEHLANDLNQLPDGADARSLVSYALVAHWVQVLGRTLSPQGTHCQFEVRMVLPGLHGPLEQDTMVVSPVMPCL